MNLNGNDVDTIQVEVFDNGNSGVGGGEFVDFGIANVDITPVNDGPLASDDVLNTSVGQPLTISFDELLANDSDLDGDSLTVLQTLVDAPQNGAVSFDNNSLTFTPNSTFAGTDSFTYQISDQNGGFSQATVTVQVDGAPGIPPIPGTAPPDSSDMGELDEQMSSTEESNEQDNNEQDNNEPENDTSSEDATEELSLIHI